MNGLILEMPTPRFIWPAWREHGFAFGVALALHAGLAYVLLNLSQQTPMLTPVSAVLTTQLINLPPVTPPEPTPALVEPPAPAPLPEPVVPEPVVEQADLAFKRVEQERQEKLQQAKREQQQREQALRQERLAREEQQRQALKEQQLAQARQAEAERLAEAERQAAANAAAAARAEAEAASRQYLPIAKQAPDYPVRALERKIEGECTVAYTVTAAGRVEDPKILGSCHPFFVKPSLEAAKTFRYQPRIVNGQAVPVANVKNTFTYRIQ